MGNVVGSPRSILLTALINRLINFQSGVKGVTTKPGRNRDATSTQRGVESGSRTDRKVQKALGTFVFFMRALQGVWVFP